MEACLLLCSKNERQRAPEDSSDVVSSLLDVFLDGAFLLKFVEGGCVSIEKMTKKDGSDKDF